MTERTPVQIVAALDRHIVGQMQAKRAVAIAIRNRWRRQQLDPTLRDEVLPKNIILIGSTGVGKTEIARRVSHLVKAPFLKVEASKYTEVGYHGRDVESMVRDLTDVAVGLVRAEELARVEGPAAHAAEERLVDAMVPPAGGFEDAEAVEQRERTRDTFRRKLAAGALEDREVEILVDQRGALGVDIFSPQGFEQLGIDMQGLMQRLGGQPPSRRRMRVGLAREVLRAQEAERLLDTEKIQQEGRRRAEQSGIIFLDEIDKIISRGTTHGPEVSREGVQRDLLPVVEGCSVNTRHGMVRTDHVLFIGAGAFHGVKPTELIPELQGRFPIRVELDPLHRADFVRILEEPENALPRQYAALLATEGVEVRFSADGLARIAEIAWELNRSTQDIGARRLYAVFERLLEEPLFQAPDLIPPDQYSLEVTAEYVDRQLGAILADQAQTSYIL